MYRLIRISDFEKLCQTIIDLAIIESKTKSRGPGCYGCGKHRMVLHHNYESESTSKSTDNALNYLNCDEPKQVAIYSRTLSNGSALKDSFENQSNHYNNLIREHPNWKLIDIYNDEVFIDGNQNQNHESFNNLISDCKSGKIDLIVTKSISQFCPSLSDSLIVIKELSELPNPVSVIFEIEGICTIGDI